MEHANAVHFPLDHVRAQHRRRRLRALHDPRVPARGRQLDPRCLRAFFRAQSGEGCIDGYGGRRQTAQGHLHHPDRARRGDRRLHVHVLNGRGLPRLRLRPHHLRRGRILPLLRVRLLRHRSARPPPAGSSPPPIHHLLYFLLTSSVFSVPTPNHVISDLLPLSRRSSTCAAAWRASWPTARRAYQQTRAR